MKTHDGERERYEEMSKKLMNAEDGVLTQTDQRLIAALKNLPQDYWDFKDSDVREYTHGIHNYPAMMVCPISRNIIKMMKEHKCINTVLDPFSGSGTVLTEAVLAGIDRVYGNDINPLALFLTKVKTTKLDMTALQRETRDLLARIDEAYRKHAEPIHRVNEAMQRQYSLDLTAKDGWGSEAPQYLERYKRENDLNIETPSFKNLGYWFKPNVILLVSLIKAEINRIENGDIRDFVFVALSETLRFVSNRRNGEFKMFRMPVNKVEHFEPDVIREFSVILHRNVAKMNDFVEACSERKGVSAVFIHRDDAAVLEDVPNESVDLVITSPPYGDSRTTVAYGEYSRLSLQWLDVFELTEKEIMGMDKSMMGGSKYRNGFEYNLPSPTLKKSLEVIKGIDVERAGDVYSFYNDLAKAIETVAEKTKADGYQFWVVGNRTVKGETLLTDVIISEMAESYGLRHIFTADRHIINKVMPAKNSPTNESGVKSSTMTNEHIVILRKP